MENVKIKFDKEQSDERTSTGWQWFFGVAKVADKEFEFTLCEMTSPVGGQDTSATEITWIEDTPEESPKIEKEIEKQFRTEFH